MQKYHHGRLIMFALHNLLTHICIAQVFIRELFYVRACIHVCITKLGKIQSFLSTANPPFIPLENSTQRGDLTRQTILELQTTLNL